MKKINRTSQNQYQYDLYKEYLTQIKKNTILYANNPELVIKYFKINFEKSNNIDQTDSFQNVPGANIQKTEAETSSVIHGTGMFDKFENFTYDIFEFTPVIEMTPFQYTPNSDLNSGTVGEISLMAIDKPTVGDLFVYYSNNDSIDQHEILQITSVQFQRTSTDLLPIYKLEYKTANIKFETLKKVSINEIYFYDNLQNNFTSSKCWDDYQQITKMSIENTLSKTFDKLYDSSNSRYYLNRYDCENPNQIIQMIPLLLNNFILKIIPSSYNQGRFKIVRNITTNVSIQEYLNFKNSDESIDPSLAVFKLIKPVPNDDPRYQDNVLKSLKEIFLNKKINNFIISNVLQLYLFYYKLYKNEIYGILPENQKSKSKILEKLEQFIYPDDLTTFLNENETVTKKQEIFEKYNTEEPIAFLDKDLITDEFIIIDNLKFIKALPKWILSQTTGEYSLEYPDETNKKLTSVQKFINNNFMAYLLFYKYILSAYKLVFCKKVNVNFENDLEKEKSYFTSNRVKNTKYFNIFCDITSNINETIPQNMTDSSIDIYYDKDGNIPYSYSKYLVLPIGDLGLPIALSFQYGVQYRDHQLVQQK